MQFRNTIDVTQILKRGTDLYKTTWSTMIKYSFLSVVISYLISLYILVVNTLFIDSEIIYISSLLILLLLYLPIMYFTFRITMTNVAKYRAIILKQSFDYKDKYIRSKDKFWRIAVIFIIKTILKAIALMSIAIPVLYGFGLFNSEKIDLILPLWGFLVIIVVGLCVLLPTVYLLIRLEFASVIVFWDIESDVSDLATSMRMTKHHLFKKMKVMFVAHVPGIILALISLLYIFWDVDSASGWIGLANIIVSIMINTALFSWIYSLYYPLFEQMRAFTFEKGKTIDAQGREWTTY